MSRGIVIVRRLPAARRYRGSRREQSENGGSAGARGGCGAADATASDSGSTEKNFDDEACTLTFSDPARPSIIADVRLVGSYSTKSNTFQWAWETFDDCAPEAHEISRLRVFGEIRGLASLTTANWTCDEVDGWEMASLAGYLLGADAVYRAPFDHLRWFMLLSNLRHEN